VSPASVSTAVGAQVQLTAIDGAGDPVQARWKSNDQAVASVTNTGLVSGVGAGTAVVTAQVGKAKATANITVSAAPVPTVATVVVAPPAATLLVGGAVQLSAAALDSAGHAIVGQPVSWSSANPSVASVDPNGLATATGAGTAVIAATIAGKIGTATLTVSAPSSPPAGPAVHECASMNAGWIWCDDYEVDRLGQYFEVDGGFTRTTQVGVQGSSGMRARWTIGQVNAGSLKLAFGRTPSTYFRPIDSGTRDYREMYWRFYLRNQPGWTGGGGHKLARIISFATAGWAEAMIGHVWSDPPSTVLTLDPASGTDVNGVLKTTKYNDFANLRWLGIASGQTTLFDAAHVGSWYCIETRVRLNDAGLSNGVFEFWINGNLEASRSNLNWVGSYSAYGLNALFLENYWNNGAPAVQERYFDNFVVSTQRIGC
jgi:hypothetical protein